MFGISTHKHGDNGTLINLFTGNAKIPYGNTVTKNDVGVRRSRRGAKSTVKPMPEGRRK
jgi:hypothetical protein